MNKTYKIRTVLVFLLFCSLYLIIGINLFLIQIMQNSFFKNLGKNQYNVTVTMQPERAPIFDRSGKQFLAMNKNCFSAFILPKQIINEKTLLSFLEEHFPEAVTRLENSKEKHFMFVKRKLTDEQVSIIQESNIQDIHLLKEPNRFYPIESTSTFVGITNIDNKGLSGIELRFNGLLSGTPTTFSLEKDARSGCFHFKKETKVAGKTSTPVILTIDSDLQFLATEELTEWAEKYNAKEGAVLIMNPQNGDILAMVNYPYFDPNEKQSFNLNNSKNVIVTQCYELGSVIKVFAALAALEEGVTRTDEMIDCKSKKTAYIDGRQINTVKAHGLLSVSQIIEKSNNIGIAIIAKRIGENIYNHYKKMGFGEKTDISFPGEQKGFINPPNKWSKQSIISLSYGYEISATLLQLAKAFCLIARNGSHIQPRLLLSPTKPITREKVMLYRPESIAAIKQILENTTLKGTTRRARIKGYKVMSKTGTANLLVNGKYSQDDNIFTCAGIIEKGNYQRVIITFLKEIDKKGVYAQSVAVPLFEKIAEKTLINDKII